MNPNIRCDIPDNFNLGYACLNMTLRAQKPPVFSSRTVRLATLQEKGIDYVKNLAIENLKDLLTIIKWNVEHDIFFMRMSSEIFPFASHPVHGYSIDFADDLLKSIGDYAKQNGVRLTMHPGQYDVLSSPKEDVVNNTILDLNHHADIMNRMGLGPDGVMLIHGGGVYDCKTKALQRLEQNIERLPQDTRKRLVLENCEMAYTVEELLPISEKLLVPIVIDFHHDDINPSKHFVEYYFNRVFDVWHKRGIKPKVHVSNSVPDIPIDAVITQRRKHSDFIYFFHSALYKIDFPIDVMLECKMKELAIKLLKKV